MDEVDRLIISRLEKDGRLTYEELAKECGITGVAIKKRIRKLTENNLILIGAQLNTKAQENMRKIIRAFGRCPRIISMFTGLGRYNLVALTLAEDRDTLESEMMSGCSLRSMEGIRKSEVIQLGEKFSSPFLPVRCSLATREGEYGPCGVNCGSCDRYDQELCLGCPATRFYRGDL